MNTRWRIFVALAIPVAIGIGVTISGCEPETIPDDQRNGAHGKAIRVEITDSPANYSRMDLQIDRVEVYHDVKGWIALHSLVRGVNILSLANGATTALAVQDNSKVGHYSAVRIWFGAENTVTVNTAIDIGDLHVDAGGIAPLSWALDSAFVVVKIDRDVTEDKGMSILLDFNAEKSVFQNDEALWLHPVLTVMTHRLTGVSGRIGGGIAPGFIRLQNELNMYSAYSTPEGKFLVRGMLPGTYHLNIRVIKRAPDGTLVEKVYERDDIRVALGQITLLDDIPF